MNKKKIGTITAKFIKLSSEYSAPETKILPTDNYIRIGKKNYYPYYLQDLLRDSGLHRSIIERKVNMLVGSGLTDEDGNDITWQPNPYETIEEVLLKCAYDLETYGTYYLQIIWERGGKQVKEIYHMEYPRMRVGLPNELNMITDYYYWTNHIERIQSWTELSQFQHFSAFNTQNKTEAQILAVTPYSPTNVYYGSPCYEGSLLDIQTYAEISNYHNSNIHNNFAPGYTIFFRGPEPDDDSQDAIVETLMKKYSGSENTGKPMVFFLDAEQQAPLIETLESSDLDKRFEQLSQSIKENIVISHQIPRQVVGLESAGSLGNSKEILQASQMFRTDYIQPHQVSLLRGFNMVMGINAWQDIKIVNPNPNVLLFDMEELLKILTQNEVRELIGYEEIDESEMNIIDGEEDNTNIKEEEND